MIVDAATDTAHQAHTERTSKSGLTIGLSGSIGDAINNAISETQAARNSSSGNDRAAALHAMAAAGDVAFAGMGAYKLLNGATGAQAPSIGIQFSVGSSHSSSQSSEDQAMQRGSSVQSGGTATFVATGNGAPGDGNITISGSDVNAKDVLLAAKNQVNLVNTTNTDVTQSSNSSSGASFGVSIGTNGIGVSASMQRAHGDGNSNAAMQNNTHVKGADTVAIVSGGDTNIIGSDVKGGAVTANVGGNLNVASVQDTTVSTAHQSSMSAGFSISETGGSASFSAQNGHADANYAGVNEQAGIEAGSGGFNVNVKGNTDLNGAYIASMADASKNSLSTGTLTTSDIENHSHYSANSAGFSAGASVGPSTKAVGPSSVSGSGGVTPMVFQNDSGDQSATTKSAVSAGTITITKPDEQRQDLANLNRDATHLNGTVSKNPDVQKALSQQADTMNAAQAAGQTVSQAIGLYADHKRDAALDAAKAAYDSGDLAGAQAALNEAKGWMEGGTSRAELQMGGGALIGGLGGGSVLTAIGGAAGAGMSSLLAGQAEKISKSVGDTTSSSLVGNIAANVAATVGGALVGGSAGASAASNVQLYNADNDSRKQQSNDVFSSLSKKVAQAIVMTADAKAGVWNGMVNVAGVIVNIPNGGPLASPGDPGYVSLDGLKKPYKSGTSIGPDTEFLTPILATLGLGGKAAVGTDAAATSADVATVGGDALKNASGDLSAAANSARNQPYGQGASASQSPGTQAASSGSNISASNGSSGPATIVASNPVDLNAFDRLNVVDPAVGKFRPGEAGAAAELENYLGGTLQRAPQGSSVDFVFSSGPNNGKTVDFMLTPDTVAQATKINQFFDKNLNNFMSTLSDHAAAADFVPLDSRFLSEVNKTLLIKAIGNLPQKLQAKIILIK